MSRENKPATIRRPGAETKVGGFPFTTMGFKAPPVIRLKLLKEVEEEEGSTSLRGWEGGGGGNGVRQSEAILLTSVRLSPFALFILKHRKTQFLAFIVKKEEVPQPSYLFFFFFFWMSISQLFVDIIFSFLKFL
jgi:hypothetical protein